MKLDSHQHEILRLLVDDNPMGRVGWPLQTWEKAARKVCDPMIKAGLVTFRRLGGFPGVEITDKGREAYQSMKRTG